MRSWNISRRKVCIVTKGNADANTPEDIPFTGLHANDLDPLGDEFAHLIHSELKGRVGKKRLSHIEGVAATAQKLAEVYGLDADKARLAGLLHDWDKGMNDEQIRIRVHDLGIEDEVGEWVMENMPEVIHGISASAALKKKFPQIPEDVLHAVKVHTTACIDMTDLDKILYIADAIEPGRNFDELEDLQAMIGNASLDDLFFEVYKFWTEALIRKNRALHPATIDIWNAYSLDKRKRRKA